MLGYKSTIIRKYGEPVDIFRFDTDSLDLVSSTKALIGRSSKTVSNMFRLATQKEAIFLPDQDVQNGDYVYLMNTDEMFIVVGTHNEYGRNSVISIVSNILKCEYVMTVKGYITDADDRGNIKKIFGDKYSDIPCFYEHISGDLKQYDPGLNPEAEYRIYTTAIEIEETDRIEIYLRNTNIAKKFKVVSIDPVSLPGLLIIDVEYDNLRQG